MLVHKTCCLDASGAENVSVYWFRALPGLGIDSDVTCLCLCVGCSGNKW